jgi:hypothetical protein
VIFISGAEGEGVVDRAVEVEDEVHAFELSSAGDRRQVRSVGFKESSRGS